MLFSIIVLSFVFFGKHTAEPAITLNASDEIWVITDPHYLSPSLQDNGVAFQKMQATSAGKDLIYGKERMEALVAQVEQERPKALLVSGDLTFNGEYQSFVDLANFFKQIESFGTKVLVEPGNHDIADGWARKFIGEQNYKTRQLTAAEFSSLFAEFGYKESPSRDSHSLSYIAKPFTNLWFLMIDSNIYEKKGEGKGAPATGGVIPKETLQWIESQLQKASQEQVKIIPVMHHNLLQHHELNPDGFIVDNASDLKAVFAKYPRVKLGFSGHIHTQHIATESFSSTQSFTEIVNGAFSMYPATIGRLTVSNHEMHFQQTSLDIDSWAKRTNPSNSDLVNHLDYLKNVLEDSTRRMVMQSLTLENKYPTETAEEFLSLLSPLNTAYFSGKAITSEWVKEKADSSDAYRTLKSNGDEPFIVSYFESLIHETTHAQNEKISISY